MTLEKLELGSELAPARRPEPRAVGLDVGLEAVLELELEVQVAVEFEMDGTFALTSSTARATTTVRRHIALHSGRRCTWSQLAAAGRTPRRPLLRPPLTPRRPSLTE